jgi:hypothetical protein
LRRNCLLQRVIEGKIQGGIEVTGRRWRRRRKLLDDLKEKRGYFHLKEETLARTMWRARFGRGFGPVVRQNTNKWMNFSNMVQYAACWTQRMLTCRLSDDSIQTRFLGTLTFWNLSISRPHYHWDL